MDWFASSLLILGLWTAGNKWRHAFLLTAIGEALWIWILFHRLPVQWPLVLLCVVFCGVASRNWWKWRPEA